MRLGTHDKETYMSVLKKGIDGLYHFCITPDYSIKKNFFGCLCPGQGDMKGNIEAYIVVSHPTKDDSHAFGPVILAMIEADKNDIENIVK